LLHCKQSPARCLNVPATGDGVGVELAECSAADGKRFQLRADGTIRVRAGTADEKCLEVEGGSIGLGTPNDRVLIQTGPCDPENRPYQVFNQRLSTAIDISGQQVTTHQINGSASFTLTPELFGWNSHVVVALQPLEGIAMEGTMVINNVSHDLSGSWFYDTSVPIGSEPLDITVTVGTSRYYQIQYWYTP
jgi:hypothetical protein